MVFMGRGFTTGRGRGFTSGRGQVSESAFGAAVCQREVMKPFLPSVSKKNPAVSLEARGLTDAQLLPS